MTAYLERPRVLPLLGYALAALVALYAHTTMIVFVALANLAMLWLLRRDRRALALWLAANAAVALLWSWWAWISLGQAEAAGSAFGWIDRPDPGEALGMTGAIYLPLYLAGQSVLFLPLLTLAWLAGFAWFAARDRRPAVILLAVLAVGAPVTGTPLPPTAPLAMARVVYEIGRASCRERV